MRIFSIFVRTKQVIVNQVKGTRNPSDVLTAFLDTDEAVRNAIDLIGLVDLTQQGLDGMSARQT